LLPMLIQMQKQQQQKREASKARRAEITRREEFEKEQRKAEQRFIIKKGRIVAARGRRTKIGEERRAVGRREAFKPQEVKVNGKVVGLTTFREVLLCFLKEKLPLLLRCMIMTSKRMSV